MIHQMVDRLAGDLKANPHDADGWMRLMRARMVLGEDLSIGYLFHDAEHVRLYFQESFSFAVYTAEASVAITGSRPS